MQELLLADDSHQSRDPFLQRRGQPDEHHRTTLREAAPPALALEYQNLRLREWEEPLHETGRAALDRRHPPRGYLPLLHPLLTAVLDQQHNLGGDIRAHVWQLAAAQLRPRHIDPSSLQLRKRGLVELPLQRCQHSCRPCPHVFLAAAFQLLAEGIEGRAPRSPS